MKIKVIDVSKYQGSINWSKVKAAGVKGAIIRCGYANRDGSITEDHRFKANMAGAIAAGVDVGVYVYSYVESEEAARKAAQRVLDMVRGYKVTYPLAWDYEDHKTYKLRSKAQNTAICRAALSTWEEAGYYAILYTYRNFAATYLNMAQLADYDFWLAHYASKTDYAGPYGMWQYSSSGSVDGISGRVDMNWAYKDYPAIIKKAGLNKAAKLTTYKVGPLSEGDAKQVKALADKLQVGCVEV